MSVYIVRRLRLIMFRKIHKYHITPIQKGGRADHVHIKERGGKGNNGRPDFASNWVKEIIFDKKNTNNVPEKYYFI